MITVKPPIVNSNQLTKCFMINTIKDAICDW